MPTVQTVKRGEVVLRDAFCVFELIASDEQFKQHMQAPVAIDFSSHVGNRYALLRFLIRVFTLMEYLRV